MKNETYAFETKDMITGFIDAMSNIVIRRYDDNRNIVDKVRVTMMYAPKQRVLFDIVNPAKAIILPVVSVFQGGLKRDNDRVFNKLEGSYYDTDQTGSDVAERLYQPVPVDLTLNVSILTRYQADLDQIITNFVPYFDPYIVIEWRVPAFGHVIKSPVYWNENINLTYPIDATAETPYRIIADTSFTMKGWLFKLQPKGVQKIYVIESTYTPVRDLPIGWFDVRTDPGSAYETDFRYISAVPFPLNITPLATTTASMTGTLFSVYGDMLGDTIGVFLSASTPIFTGLTAIDYFSTNQQLSARFPAFSAVPALDFTPINNNKLIFDAPPALSAGTFDVYVVNLAGYASLMQTAHSISLANPYPVGSGDYNNYISPYSPEISGVRVLSAIP